jgi:hypothetical protein
MQVESFPFDTPNCTMNYTSQDYDARRLLLVPFDSGTNIDYYEENRGKLTTSRCCMKFGAAPYLPVNLAPLHISRTLQISYNTGAEI